MEPIGPLPRQHGMLAAMLHEATPEAARPTSAGTPAFEGWPAAHPDLTDFLGLPIPDGEDVLGTSSWPTSGSPGGFTEDDEELLTLLAEHAAIALTNARLYERSRELTVVAEERTRIAHELHDAVAQKLFSLRLTAQAAAALVDRDPARAKGSSSRSPGSPRRPLDELRAAVFELRPAALDEDGLVATLRTQVQVLDRAHSARRHLHRGRGPAPCPRRRRRRCSASPRRPCTTRCGTPGADACDVTLGDRGTGAPCCGSPTTAGASTRRRVRAAGRHLGLVSMRDRAGGVGGELTVEIGARQGHHVELEVPGG